MDEDFSWAKWDNKHVSEGLLEFISSNYQEVRLAAVQNLAFVFQKSSSVAGQQNIFERLHKKVINLTFAVFVSLFYLIVFSVMMYF